MAIKIDVLQGSSGTVAHLIREAGAAGATLGNSGKSVRACIREAATVGVTEYLDATAKAMRSAYAEGAVANGTTRNNGLGLFARAWDELVKEGRVNPRPKRNTGRNAKASSATSNANDDSSAGNGNGKAAKAAKVSAEEMARAKQAAYAQGFADATRQQSINIEKVQAKAVESFVSKHIKIETVIAAIIAAKEAAPSLKAGKVDSFVKDLAFVNKALCDMLGKAYASGGVDVTNTVKDAVKAHSTKK